MEFPRYFSTRTFEAPVWLRQNRDISGTLRSAGTIAVAALACVLLAYVCTKYVMRVQVVAFGLGDTLFWTLAAVVLPVFLFCLMTIDLWPLAYEQIMNAQLKYFGEYLQKNIRAARIAKTPIRYLRDTLVQTVTVFGIVVFGCILTQYLGFSFTSLFPVSDAALWTFFIVLAPAAVYILMIVQPSMICAGRKSKIDLDLPYAISYMQALSTTVAPYEVIRKIYEEQSMFREVSREFGFIVRDVEVFGDDFLTAMRNLQDVTPSKVLGDFINDLSIVFESGGSVSSYLATRTEYFREQAKREQELVLQTIEIMAEVYVAAFVAAPIAMIILMVAQGLSGASQLDWMMPFMIISIPVGSFALIWALSLMLPTESLDISQTRAEMEPAGTMVPLERLEEADPVYLRGLEEKRKKYELMQKLRHPVRTYMSNYDYALIASAVCALAVVLLMLTGFFQGIFPRNPMESAFCVLIIAFLLPLSVAYELRKRYISSIESKMPDFLRNLSDMKDIGITLQEAIRRISNAKLGVLSSELKVVTTDIQAGTYLNYALNRMEQRIGLVSVKRAVSLLVRASEITSNLRQIFMIAIADFEHYLQLKKDRTNTTIVYVMIIYLSVGIYLFTAYQLNGPFMESFIEQGVASNLAATVTSMYVIAIVLAGCSGIMAGQFTSNSILAGFKHSIILLAVTVFLFTYVIGGSV